MDFAGSGVFLLHQVVLYFLDEVTWTTKNWHGLQMQRLSVVLYTAVAWQTVNELACGDSGIVHGAKCIAE